MYAINKMLVNFDEKYTDDLRQKVADSGYSIREILTIASLVERETDGTDRGTIASVIYNRLNNPSAGTMGYLQIDATLAFLNGGKVPTEADKAIDSPYNTYLYKGLPPPPSQTQVLTPSRRRWSRRRPTTSTTPWATTTPTASSGPWTSSSASCAPRPGITDFCPRPPLGGRGCFHHQTGERHT